MENNTFNIVNYFNYIFLKSLYIVLGTITFTMYLLGVRKSPTSTFYDKLGVDQETAVILLTIGIFLTLIFLNFYLKVRCIIGSLNFNEKDIKLSAKNTENEVNYDECIINNKKLAVLDVENSLNPGFSTFTFYDNGIKKKIHFKIEIDDLYYLKQILKEKQNDLLKIS